jgi:hypothetical protein
MLGSSFVLQIKRLRRNVWPAKPGSSRSAFYDVLFGLALLSGLVLRFPDGEYSYLIQAARDPTYRAGGTLAWVTLVTSLGFTCFLVGSPIRTTLSRVFYYFVPRSWRSLTYRRIMARTMLESENVLMCSLSSTFVIEHPKNDQVPSTTPSEHCKQCETTGVTTETGAGLLGDEQE